MKNISYVMNGIVAVTVAILAGFFFSCSANNDSTEVKPLKFAAGDTTAILPIAYVNVDSLLTNYQFAKDATDRLMNKFKSSNNTVAQKQRTFEAEVTEYQRKAQNNAFISQERAQQEGLRLQKMEAELQQMAQRLQQELAQEEQKINMQIADSVRLVLKEYNAKANYEVIFSNKGMDNILIAKDRYDITKTVLDLLNSRYKAENAKK